MAEDNTLKIMIQLGVIGKDDAEAVKALLKETGEAASNVAKATAETGTAANGAARATNELGQSTKATADHAGHLELNQRALQKVLQMIGKEAAPEVGVALNAAFIGPLALAMAAIVAFEKLFEHIQKTNDELDKMGDAAAGAYNNVKQNLFDALRTEEFSTEKVDKFFRHIGEQSDETKRKIENMLALTREEGAAQLEKNKADEAAQIEFVKKKYASMMPDENGNKSDREALKQQEEDEINAIKDRFAAQNAILKVQGEQAGVTAAEAIYRSLQAELNKLLMQRGAGGEMTDSQKAERSAKITSAEQEIESIKSKLGMDEKTKLPSGDGDLKRLEDLKKNNKPLVEHIDEVISKGDYHQDAVGGFQKIAWKAGMMADDFSKPETWAKAKEILQGQIDVAALAVESDKKRIEQLENQAAALKQAADAQKKLQDEIEKYILKVREARAAMEQATSSAGIKAESTFYTTDKNAQHGRDIQAVSDFRPTQGAASLDQVMTVAQYSEAQKQKVIESILNHSITSQQAWLSFGARIAWLEQQAQNNIRNRPQG